MRHTRNLTLVAVLGLLTALLPAGAAAESPHTAGASTSVDAHPRVQPGLVDALCPRVRPPDDDCYTIALPGEIWAQAAILPLSVDPETSEIEPEAVAAYDALIPEPFFPIEGKREVGVLMFRLEVELSPDRDIDTDPGEGYAEGSVALRVGFPSEDGYPYEEGWWTIAQPLNDPSQYGGGRGLGLPKYLGEAGLRIDEENGTWSAHATQWGPDPDADEPGAEPVDDGNRLLIDWSDTDPDISSEREEQLWTWGQYGEPLFVQDPPYDEAGPHEPQMVKFTPFSIVPILGLPRTPVTAAPDPRTGTSSVTLEGTTPGGTAFEDLVGPGPHTVAGTSAFTRGGSFITVDNLENNRADDH